MKQAIGLDVGHSAVKVAVDTQRLVIPSAAAKAVSLSTESARTAARDDTVTVGAEKWLVGETALIHTLGRVADGLRDDWIDTPEYQALLKAGYERGSHGLGALPDVVVVGLPSRLYAAQSKSLTQIVSSVLQVDAGHVMVVPQPLAAFFVRALPDAPEASEPAAATGNGKGKGKTRDTKVEPAVLDEDWVVVDIGYYTTDFGSVVNGIWSETAAQSGQGVSSAAEAIRQALATELHIDATVRKCAEVLRTGSIKYDGKVHDLRAAVDAAADQFANLVIERAERVFGAQLHSADGVLVVGGGAELAFKALHSRWPHAVMPKNPRFAVATGMQRAGSL